MRQTSTRTRTRSMAERDRALGGNPTPKQRKCGDADVTWVSLGNETLLPLTLLPNSGLTDP